LLKRFNFVSLFFCKSETWQNIIISHGRECEMDNSTQGFTFSNQKRSMASFWRKKMWTRGKPYMESTALLNQQINWKYWNYIFFLCPRHLCSSSLQNWKVWNKYTSHYSILIVNTCSIIILCCPICLCHTTLCYFIALDILKFPDIFFSELFPLFNILCRCDQYFN
jgi:hypothetical protein